MPAGPLSGPVVVTGATGHIGNVLVRALVARGERVRCLVLPSDNLRPLAGLAVEVVRGDVRDPRSLDAAFAGAGAVFHLASVITLTPDQARVLHEVNVAGARNVAEACLKAGVRRLVHTSSVHAMAEPPEGVVIDESAPFDPARIRFEYGRTKAPGTLEVLAAAGRGLDAVVVCPTGVIGPFDFAPSEMGRLFLAFARRRVWAYPDGGYDFVDVRDAAEGHLLAAEKGRTGESYLTFRGANHGRRTDDGAGRGDRRAGATLAGSRVAGRRGRAGFEPSRQTHRRQTPLHQGLALLSPQQLPLPPRQGHPGTGFPPAPGRVSPTRCGGSRRPAGCGRGG